LSEANGQIWPGCRGTLLLIFEGHPMIFNDHRESGPRFNVTFEGRCFFTVVSQSHRPQDEHPLLASPIPPPPPHFTFYYPMKG